MLTPEEIVAVNKTARSTGAIGKNAIVPRYVAKIACKDEYILDYGAGPKAIHVVALRKQGFNVYAYDIGKNQNSLYQPARLGPFFDIVYASNVLNVQPTHVHLQMVLTEMASALNKTGVLICNYPANPRKCHCSINNVQDRLEAMFGEVTLHPGKMFFCREYKGESK